MTDFTKVFPPLQTYTYLNTPVLGLLPQSVKAFRESINSGLYREGSLFYEQEVDLIPEIREKIASFFNGNPARVALMPSFSIGLNAILEGFAQKTKVFLIEEDYPSINKAVEARPFEVTYVKISADLETNIYEVFRKDPPDVFLFSIVQYLAGFKIDLEFLKKLKREFPETLLIADGTQYLGTEVFDFESSGIDVLGASALKWLNAGQGNGFFMFRAGMEDHLHPKFIGFGSDLGKYKEDGDTLIGKFEGNHLDLSAIGSIKTALALQEEIGPAFIADKIKSLGEKAKTAFEELNLLEESVVNREGHSSIFNLKMNGDMVEKLNAHRIIVSQRGNGIRVGFHYYNSENDLDKLIDVLS